MPQVEHRYSLLPHKNRVAVLACVSADLEMPGHSFILPSVLSVLLFLAHRHLIHVLGTVTSLQFSLFVLYLTVLYIWNIEN